MNFLKVKNNLIQIFDKYHTVIIFLMLGGSLFVSGYWRFTSLGIYGDDWGASTYVFQHSFFQAVLEWWKAGAGEVANFRLLDSVLPTFWFGIFHTFGLVGIIFFNYLCFLVLSWLLFLILNQHLSTKAAFIGAMVFALYPTNNAYLWQVTLSYTLSLIFIFSAVLLFYKLRIGWTLFFLFFALFINEGTFFIFVLGLLTPGAQKLSELKPILMKWLKIMIPLTFFYGFIRLGLELIGLTGGNRAVSILHNFNMVSYVLQFFKAEAVVLIISWAVTVWKLYHYFFLYYIFVGAFVAIVTFLGLYISQRDNSEKPPLTKPLLVILTGLVAICAGRYYGFYYVPSINVLNLDTRYYFAASVGGAMVFAGLFDLILAKYTRFYLLSLVISALLVGYLAVFRFAVQSDYAIAWKESQKIWKELLLVLPSVPGNGLLYVEIPGKELGRLVTEFEAVGDLRGIVPLLGRKDVVAVTSPFVSYYSLNNSEVCITSPPFYKDRCFSNDKAIGLTWSNGGLKKTFGVFSPINYQLSVPQSFYEVIEEKK